ncbi:TetR family transcriptional regulator C-terminal domain-containing protein [Pseudomonas sp. P8_241]|jgi:TetR/AcrR family transcriptional regulator|uniref:TetR family transcriptional regulator C-terminal domain-containing protein n=1 Tax=Pseudomonas sp. P8_241 TaxID=3043445 RepID=UPI002A368B0A|nr:TetR family transcriptional regulator C-terminal domain-containing protein [Pseudomonas sp. P8_241]WPN49658.1 TetR family transcriptional regulator C-terminal domain-containing protein [Pseudomonas sp. P8_241]
MSAIKTPEASLRNSKQNRKEILQSIRSAAISEFSLHGYSGASTQSIAERAGLKKSQLHYYIEDKESLYNEVLAQIFTRWEKLFILSDASHTPAQVIADYVRQKLDFALQEPELSRVFTHELISGGLRLQPFWPQAVAATEEKVERLQAWVDAGQLRPLNPRLLIMHIWALTQYYADYSVQAERMLGESLQNPDQRQKILDELVEFVLAGCGLSR